MPISATASSTTLLDHNPTDVGELAPFFESLRLPQLRTVWQASIAEAMTHTDPEGRGRGFVAGVCRAMQVVHRRLLSVAAQEPPTNRTQERRAIRAYRRTGSAARRSIVYRVS